MRAKLNFDILEMRSWSLAQLLVKERGQWWGSNRVRLESQTGSWCWWGGKEQRSLKSVFSLTKGQENLTSGEICSVLPPVLTGTVFLCVPTVRVALGLQLSAAGNGVSRIMFILLIFLPVIFFSKLPHILLLQAFLWQHSLSLVTYLIPHDHRFYSAVQHRSLLF